MSLLSQPARPVGGMNYDREARRLLRSGYREAANRVAVAGVENRRSGIQSYEGRKEEERLARAADRFDRMSRYRALTGRGEAAKPEAETQPAAPAKESAAAPAATKPFGNMSPSEYAASVGKKAMEQDKSDAEGKKALNEKADALLAKAQTEYDKKRLFETASSSTEALNKAVAESKAKSDKLLAPKPTTGKAPLADDLASIAESRKALAEALAMPKVEGPPLELRPLRFPKSPAQRYAESNAELEAQGRRNVLGSYSSPSSKTPISGPATEAGRGSISGEQGAARAEKSAAPALRAALPSTKLIDPKKEEQRNKDSISQRDNRVRESVRKAKEEEVAEWERQSEAGKNLPAWMRGTAAGKLLQLLQRPTY